MVIQRVYHWKAASSYEKLVNRQLQTGNTSTVDISCSCLGNQHKSCLRPIHSCLYNWLNVNQLPLNPRQQITLFNNVPNQYTNLPYLNRKYNLVLKKIKGFFQLWWLPQLIHDTVYFCFLVQILTGSYQALTFTNIFFPTQSHLFLPQLACLFWYC